MSRSRINIPVVVTVALLSAAALTLFFLSRQRNMPAQPAPDSTLLQPVDTTPQTSELDYYGQLADEFLATMPQDKIILLTLIDSLNHHILYTETSNQPSCYLYDLESLTTSVLFGGENGFYADTKLIIPGAIQQWRVAQPWIIFIARNRAPETDYTNQTLVFSLNVESHQVQLIDTGAQASFSNDSTLTVTHATLLYHSIFSGDDVYDESTTTYRL